MNDNGGRQPVERKCGGKARKKKREKGKVESGKWKYFATNKNIAAY